MSTYSISLLDNANGSFGEAVEKAVLAESVPLQWKYTILFVVQAFELSPAELLAARMERVDELEDQGFCTDLQAFHMRVLRKLKPR